jgi:hypothetical protein
MLGLQVQAQAKDGSQASLETTADENNAIG